MPIIRQMTNAIIAIILLYCINQPVFAESIKDHGEHSKTIKQLKISLKTQDTKLLFKVRHDIDNIWCGEKTPDNNWLQLRDKQLVVLLNALNLIDSHVDWKFDDSVNVSDTLNPPLDHNIMMYSKGFGLSTIKNQKQKEKIKEKLKSELQRLKAASTARYFQRQVNQHYTRWLSRYTAIMTNSFNSTSEKSNKSYFYQLLTANLNPSKFTNCLQKLADIFYQKGIKHVDGVINKTNGNCESIFNQYSL